MANLRVKKKHLNPDSVDSSKLKLLKGEGVRVVDENDAVVDLVKLDVNGNVIGNGFELARRVDLEAEISSRQAAISAEESARIAGDLNEQSSRVAAIETEASARSAANEVLLAGLNAETSARIAGDEALQVNLDIEVSSRQAALDAEMSRAMAAESSLQGAIVAEASSRQAAIADLINSAPAVLDTLKELADALGGDENFATTIANRFSSIESSLSAATEDGTDYTDLKHQEILDLLSDTLLQKEEVVISAQNVADGYVTLAATNVVGKSMTAFIDRLAVFEGEDFSLSVVDGATRMTFLNSFAPGGDEGVEENEKIRLTYWSLT